MKAGKWLILMLWLLGFGRGATAQTKDGNIRVSEALASKKFTFRAQYIQPMSGPQTYLTGVEYTVEVTPDSLICYLPYRGVVYSAPIDLKEGGLKFTSRNFSYTSNRRKNGRTEIIIEPRDNQQVQRFNFSISPGGTTYLSVALKRAQPVSYSGELE